MWQYDHFVHLDRSQQTNTIAVGSLLHLTNHQTNKKGQSEKSTQPTRRLVKVELDKGDVESQVESTPPPPHASHTHVHGWISV